MPSNRTPTRFYGPSQLSSTPATLYTVPANKIAVIRAITIFTGAGADQVSIGLNGTNTEDIFHYDNLALNLTVDRWKYTVAVEADTIDGFGDGGNATVTIDGDLYDE